MTNNGADKRSVFAIYVEDPPAAAVEPTPQATPPEVRKLLEWLQTWGRPTICARDIYRHGPAPLRDDRKSALEAAEILEKRGWFIPLKSHRYDRKRWQVTIGPV